MHEFSFCEGIVKTLLQEYRKLPRPDGKALTVTRVRLAAGKLRQIVPESLALAYEVLTRETPLAGSRLDLRFIPVSVRCRACGRAGEIELPLFVCPSCASRDVELAGGNELYIEDMEVETDE